ncbi:MAG: DNA polymerase/3'-5' exonuclease PolX [Anaerolineae bacterium]|nr:DNA polymerase/3'-5' exonuclease PolX [Anaerolineae bacterium]
MALTNREIADLFERVSDMLEIRGDIIHRVLSYRRAAETIRELPRDLRAIAAEGTLTELPNIGKTLAEKIEEMLTTGELEFYNRLAQEIPPSLVDIMHINGVGPKKAALFWKELDITSVEQLKAAAEAGKLRDLPRMGEKSEKQVLAGIEALSRRTGRTPLGVALPAAQEILDRLLNLPQAIEGAIAGSIRRGRPTIGDVDILIASDEAAPIMDTFVTMPNVARILGHGPTKSSVELQNGLQVDVRVLEKARWGTALNYFTGSQAHNIRMRELMLAKGYSLNEHALRPLDADGNMIEDEAQHVRCATEEEVYAAVDLPYIPPELREDSGEIEAAQQGKLPNLIVLGDLQSDLHMHTTWSDGHLSIREMAEAAQRRGRKYIVITDHSHYSTIANGLSVERLLEQQQEVRQVDAQMGPDFRVFHGVEMDIRSDGTLDLPDEVLAQLDFVIASLHFGLNQERSVITRRLLNAIENPHVDLIGHPRGQLIEKRAPADLDMDVIFEAAKKHGTALEINANPARLDLEAQYARRAVELGISLSINTDAHAEDQMDLLAFGVLTARRGWVEAASVINTWPVERFLDWTRSRGR